MNAVALWLLRQLGAALRLLLAGLIALAIWATPRIWRAVWRAALWAVDQVEAYSLVARHRWTARRYAVVISEKPAPLALTQLPHGHVRWSDVITEEKS